MRFLLAALLFLWVPVAMAAEPDTPAARQLHDWLDVFAKGDQAAYERFIAQRYAKPLLEETSAAYRAGLAGRTFLDARRFEIRTIEKSAPQEIVALAQSAMTGLWYRLTMSVDPNPPHAITAWTSQRIQPLHAQKLTPEQLVAEVSKFVDRISAADAFSGTILVAKDGKTIYSTARGFASEAYGAKINLDTKFNMASIGKSFTAVAIEQLREQGRLALTDTVGKFLPEFPNAEVKEKVTLHHLLTHTSGLGDIYSGKYDCAKSSLREVSDYFPLFADDPKPLAFAPGDHWSYSNIGYILLGRIIEKVSGQNYFAYIREHVFRPAGLTATDYYEADIDVPNRATGYTYFIDLGNNVYEFHLDRRRNTTNRITVRGNPQGGAFTTAPDLLRYTRALRDGTLVQKSTFDDMTAPRVEARRIDAAVTSWGYGFELENVNGQRVMGHTGGDFGVSSVFRFYPDSGNYTVIVLSNTDRGGQIALYKIHELIVFGTS